LPSGNQVKVEIEVESETVVAEETNEETVHSINDIARQFADGAATIKMVYVGEEDTLGSVLERYQASLDDVWNLSELTEGLDTGDCVMIRYEQSV
jgi:hypothetical protein